jgi:CheY-like chemotaxis protein
MAAPAPAVPLEVLLVEDDDADVALIEEYFDQHDLRGRLHRVTDGVEALEYLRGRRAPERPDLILLDLNLPRMDGRELLRVLKAGDSPWKSIPVVVFTTSSARADIAASYEAYANAFVTKSIDYDDFQYDLGTIHEFFGTVASLDRRDEDN